MTSTTTTGQYWINVAPGTQKWLVQADLVTGAIERLGLIFRVRGSDNPHVWHVAEDGGVGEDTLTFTKVAGSARAAQKALEDRLGIKFGSV